MGAAASDNEPGIDTLSRLPRLGFGGAAIGNLYAAISDAAAGQTVQAALDAGVRYFDTAPHYGFGLSETRLGQILAGRAEVVISSKVGRLLVPTDAGPGERHGFVDAAPFEPAFDYSYDGVMRSWEASRARLGRDRIDILLAHDLGRQTHGDDHPARLREFLDGGYRAMRDLRDSGAVGAIGLGVNEQAICEEALAHGDFDLFLLAGRYTLLEQTALEGFLPLCVRRGVKIIVGGPFNSGILVEGVGSGRPPHYNYHPAPVEIVERVRRLEAVCATHATPLAAAALQFPLAHPQVASVIPGMANPTQVAQIAGWMKVVIPSALWDDLRAEGLLHPDAPTPIAGAAA
ncbi:aldo/keto reductase [Caulobacter sp.]|uniref:aldo/keto reductase n=1 Tax=Caulobacter sp. TaxID=78 RepID=UPI003BA90D02